MDRKSIGNRLLWVVMAGSLVIGSGSVARGRAQEPADPKQADRPRDSRPQPAEGGQESNPPMDPGQSRDPQSARPAGSDPQNSTPQNGGPGYTVPRDTVITVKMDGDLNSRTAHAGDKFTATVTSPVSVNGRIAIPTGTVIEGRVTAVTPAKRMNKSGTIAVDFDDMVLPNGTLVKLTGTLTAADPYDRGNLDRENRISGNSRKRALVFVGGGGAVGAVLGGIAGGGVGAGVGAAVGAGAGLANVLLTKGSEAEVRSGTPFGVQLSQPITLDESFPSDQAGDPGRADSGRPRYTARRRDANSTADQPASNQSDPDRGNPERNDRSSSDRSRSYPDGRDRSSPDNPSDRSSQPGDPGSRPSDYPPDPDPSSSSSNRQPPVLARPEDSRSRPTTDRDRPVLTRPDKGGSGDPAQPADSPDRPMDNARPADDRGSRADGDPDADGRPASEPAAAASETDLPLSSAEMIRRAQIALTDQGYYEGPVDGVMTPRINNALKAFQRDHHLPENGDLDSATARSLGITGPQPRPAGTGPGSGQSSSGARGSDSPASRDSGEHRVAQPVPNDGSVAATIFSATAERTSDGSIHVVAQTQAPTGGWRWYGAPLVNGTLLEVDARAIKPSGMTTQVLTRGKIDLVVREGVANVSQVLVHSASGDFRIRLQPDRYSSGSRPQQSAQQGPQQSSPQGSSQSSRGQGAPAGVDPSLGRNIERRADDVLAEYRRQLDSQGGRGRADDSETHLLFALNDFANTAGLYVQMAQTGNQSNMRSATLSLARSARRADRIITTTDSRAAKAVAGQWDLIRQDVLKLMAAQHISTAEIEDR